MSYETEAKTRAKEVRQRLRNPPNAIPDTGINLKQTRPDLLLKQSGAFLVVENHEPIEPPAPKELVFPPPPAGFDLSKQDMKTILKIVCDHFEVTLEEVVSKRQFPRLVIPRQITAHVIRKVTGKSFPTIGRFLGLDHSTMIYACDRVEVRIVEDPDFRESYLKIMDAVCAAKNSFSAFR